jgi:hypothetical protein
MDVIMISHRRTFVCMYNCWDFSSGELVKSFNINDGILKYSSSVSND